MLNQRHQRYYRDELALDANGTIIDFPANNDKTIVLYSSLYRK